MTAKSRRTTAKLAIVPLVALSLLAIGAPAALAAGEQTITVNSLGLTADANAGDGTCDTGAQVGGDAECTLTAALDEANASTNADGVNIVFSVEGMITAVDGDVRMIQSVPSVDADWISNAGEGAQFLVDSTVPVNIDFAGLGTDGGVEYVSSDSGAALFYVKSDNVTLSNAGNVRSGGAGVAIGGKNVTLDGVNLNDSDTNWQETGVALLDGASDVTIENLAIGSPYFSGILVDDSATVSNIKVDNVTTRGIQTGAHIDFEDNATVNGFEVTNSTLGNAAETAAKPGLYFNPSVTLSGLKFVDSSYLTPGQDFMFFLGGAQKLTDTTISGSTFAGNANIIRDNTAAYDGIDFTDNKISDNTGYTLVFANASVKDANISKNTITDVHGAGFTSVWLNNVGTADDNNVISDNTFLQTNAAGISTDLWAIWNEGIGLTVDQGTGWTISGNSIDGYEGTANGPIANGGGKTVVEKNTFGPRTSGVADTTSETNIHYFVNNSGLANNRIQTWRPTAATFSGGKVNVTVAPVTPALAGNNDPTAPVTVDVYWTADDNAEVYLGRFDGTLTSQTTQSFDTDKTNGNIRVQTIDANGASSQYSATVQTTVAPPTAPEAPAITDADDTSVSGTGVAGATVTVTDSKDNVVGTAPVGDDGKWTVTVAAPCGETLTATQKNDDGTSPASESFETAACSTDDTTAPSKPTVTHGSFTGTVKGTGEAGAKVTVNAPNGDVVCTTTVKADGSWSCTPKPELKCGTKYNVTQTDAAGNKSEADVITLVCSGDSTPGSTPGDGGSIDNGGSDNASGPGTTGGAPLVRTGAQSVFGFGAAGALVLLAGGALVLITRRRRGQSRM